MNILVIGHSYVVDSNRQFWNQLAKNENVNVDIIVPNHWSSNLIKTLDYSFNQNTDTNFRKIYPIDCYFVGNGSKYFYHWSKMIKIFFHNKYDLVFVFQETWSLSVAQISLLKAISQNRNSLYYIAVCQNIIKKKLKWVIPWEKLITRSVDRILYCTKEIIDVLNWKKLKKKTHFLPFTYDQNIYEFKIKNIDRKKNKEIIIGYMGRLTEEKGISCLIEACRLLIKENYSIKLLLAGSGPLKDKAADSFVEYVGTFKHTEAHLFYQRINFFVLPSETRSFWKEQFGRVLVESVASGTPIIGSSSGAIPEVLSNLDLDYVFQEGNASDLTSVIKKLIHDMEDINFSIKMEHSNKLNLQKFSHKSVGRDLVNLTFLDLKA